MVIGDPSSEPPLSAEKQRNRGCLIAALLVGISFASCCGGTLVGVAIFPGYVGRMLLSDRIADVPPAPSPTLPEAALKRRVQQDIHRDAGFVLTPGDMNLIVQDEVRKNTDLALLQLDVLPGDRLSIDVSLRPRADEPRYLNVHAVGDLRIENGWATRAVFDELTVGEVDLTTWFGGADLTVRINGLLANQRAQREDARRLLDALRLVAVEDGKLRVQLSEQGLKDLATKGPQP